MKNYLPRIDEPFGGAVTAKHRLSSIFEFHGDALSQQDLAKFHTSGIERSNLQGSTPGRILSVRKRERSFRRFVIWISHRALSEPWHILVRLVMDNLNTHNIASLYETFEPKEARRLAERLEIHHTPKHGSWLNMAEIELSVLKGQCLDRRLPDMQTMRAEVSAWEGDRNNCTKRIVWQFTTLDARIKLKRLYPNI
jgi:hypothetical protein